MTALSPGEAVGHIEAGVPVDERAIVTFADTGESGNLEERDAPEQGDAGVDSRDAERLHDVGRIRALLNVLRDEAVYGKAEFVHLGCAEQARVGEHRLLRIHAHVVASIGRDARETRQILRIARLAVAEEPIRIRRLLEVNAAVILVTT